MQKTMNNKKDRLWTKPYLTLLCVQVISAFSFYMIVTVLVSFLTGASVGATTAMAGIISGLFSITSFVCRPFCGVFSDRLNKVWLLRAATIMMALGCFGYTASVNLPIIIAARIIHGIGFAVNSTALVSLASHYVPMSRLGEGIGYIGLANTVASAAAPGIGIGIADRFGLEAVFYIAGTFSMAAVVMLFLFSARKDQLSVQKKKLRFEDIFAVSVLGYCVLGGIFSFTNGVISSYLLTYSETIGVANVGVYFTLNALMLMAVRPFAGRLMDRKGLNIIAFPGFLVTAASMFLLAEAFRFGSAAYWAIMISGVVRALGQGAVNPALQTECIRQIGKERSGVANSTFYLGGDIGQGLGPMVAGAIIGMGETNIAYYSAVFHLCGAMLLAAIVILAFVQKRKSLVARGHAE